MSTPHTVIHLESTYRDRLVYPDPADFTVANTRTQGNSIFGMRNPVSMQLPVHNMYFPYVEDYSESIDFGDGVVNNSSLRITISSLNTTSIVFSKTDMDAIFGVATSHQSHAILKRLSIVLGTGLPYTMIRIADYDSMTYTATLDVPLSSTLDVSSITQCYVYNDSTRTSGALSILATEDVPTYFGQTSFTLYDVTLGVSVTVTYSDTDGHFVAQSNALEGWSINDVYFIFLETPRAIASLESIPSLETYWSTSAQTLTLVTSSSGFRVRQQYALSRGDDELYPPITIEVTRTDARGCVLDFRLIDRSVNVNVSAVYTYSSEDGLASFRVTSTWQSFLVNTTSTIPPNTVMTCVATTPVLSIDLTAFTSDQVTYNVFPLTYDTYGAHASTQTYTPGLQSMTGSAYIYDSQRYGENTLVFVTPYGKSDLDRLDPDLYDNTWWSRVIFSSDVHDQYAPFDMSRSLTSTHDMCYEIHLISLILPNVQLNATSVLTSFYPYVYVELSNLSSSHSSQSLYTNNVYGQKALFAVPISDVTSPTASKFLNLDKVRYSRQISINPHEPLKIRIFLPNGETFSPNDMDTLPPFPPNPQLQISAIFTLKRLVP